MTKLNEKLKRLQQIQKRMQKLESEAKQIQTQIRVQMVAAKDNAANSAKLLSTDTYALTIIQRNLTKEYWNIREK